MSKKRVKPTGKYPMGLFFLGVLTNFMYRHFYLCVFALIMLVAGFWRRWSLYAGLGLLALNLVFSLVQQLNFRYIALTSDDPKMRALREAIFSDDWKGNMQAWMASQKDIK